MISLIIPVYNKVNYLKRCLSSVASQTDKSAQVIIVDDGSTDGSKEILKYYEERVGFEVYYTDHKGVSGARNFGLDKAQGDYIAFLDADDVLMKDAVKQMNVIAQAGHNICQFGQYRGADFNNINYIPFCSIEGWYDFSYIPKYWVMVWNKVYKKSFLDKYNIRFTEGMQFGEDTMFNARCILANNGLHHSDKVLIVHIFDDKKSLCRGDLKLEQLYLLDSELCKLADEQTDAYMKSWVVRAINEHRNSGLYRRMGFTRRSRGKYDIVYFVKDEPVNEELVYSLRSVEANWPYRNVWFAGGCPENLEPDKMFKIWQDGMNKWEKVRRMIIEVCRNDEITEDFWLFNDDFFVLKPHDEDNYLPTYNGELIPYCDRIDARHNGVPDNFTGRLRRAAGRMKAMGMTTLNYEVHKPMLINRKKALEMMEQFPDTPAFRSLYGNYWKIGGVNKHDMKVKILNYSKMINVENYWDFVSTSDESFKDGEVGRFIRRRFDKKSRFEKEVKC